MNRYQLKAKVLELLHEHEVVLYNRSYHGDRTSQFFAVNGRQEGRKDGTWLSFWIEGLLPLPVFLELERELGVSLDRMEVTPGFSIVLDTGTTYDDVTYNEVRLPVAHLLNERSR